MQAHYGCARIAGCATTGVTIITARGPRNELIGITANSFDSVSREPPLAQLIPVEV
ncbi:MAG: flavin reductase family protein [Gammaproteobacteria bacterium]|nr:flavin reductase family protein [Gammaproteobacteria bacterium]